MNAVGGGIDTGVQQKSKKTNPTLNTLGKYNK
jgi:hypothetical protein